MKRHAGCILYQRMRGPSRAKACGVYAVHGKSRPSMLMEEIRLLMSESCHEHNIFEWYWTLPFRVGPTALCRRQGKHALRMMNAWPLSRLHCSPWNTRLVLIVRLTNHDSLEGNSAASRVHCATVSYNMHAHHIMSTPSSECTRSSSLRCRKELHTMSCSLANFRCQQFACGVPATHNAAVVNHRNFVGPSGMITLLSQKLYQVCLLWAMHPGCARCACYGQCTRAVLAVVHAAGLCLL